MKKQKKKAQPKKLPSTTKALALAPQYKETFKFTKWCEAFYDRKNKDTYGNATKSAIAVYDIKDYSTAGVIGHENLKKLKNMRATVMDMEGFGFAELMKLLTAKALAGEYDDVDRLMVRLGYFEPDPKVVVNNNTQNNFNFANIQEAIVASRKERGLTP